jgi:hypothetical protein
MAGSSIDVMIRFLGDASKLSDEAAKIEGGVGSKMKTFAKGAVASIGAVFAVDKVKDFIGAAEEANSISAGLAQSLALAGDASGDWAKHAEDLADSLMKKTGIDDEVIKSAQTILGTFHDVAGATGQASGMFDRASAAALDMSKAGFGDASSAATMLGKALEDPEKGLTALGRVGIQFTDAQKEQIKAFVETGDKAGAMGVIMKNVEGQVGGIAEKTATSSDKMNVAFGETEEAVGNALLPAFEALAPILQAVAGFIQENSSWLIPLAAAVAGVTVAVWLFNAALAANPIVLITVALAALVAGLIVAYENVDWFRTAVDTMAAAVTTAFEWVRSAVAAVFSWVSDHWPLLLGILTGPFGVAALLIQRNWDTIRSAVGAAIDFIRNTMSTVGDIIKAPFQWAKDQIDTIVDGIRTVFGNAIGFVKDVWNRVARGWNAIEVTMPTVDTHIPGVGKLGGWTLGLPDLPMLAGGGIVTGPMLAMIGERGPEAVIPLNRGGFGTSIVVNVNAGGLGADAPAIQSAVAAALRGYTRRNGPIPGIAG